MSFVTKNPCKCCGSDMNDSTFKCPDDARFCSKSCAIIHWKHYQKEVNETLVKIYRKYFK